MAQQVFSQWHPVAKALDEQGQEVYLPFAGIHAQTRDGKDEVIFGAGAMVWDPNAGMWVPVDAANPMEVRVRQLEAQIAALQQFLEGRLNADLADVLARMDTDLSTRASEQTLAQARDALSALAGTIDAGAQKVILTGSFATIKTAPTVGAKTVTSTAAELFAGASRKAGRYLMSAHNEGSLIVYWGPSGVTVNTGYPLLPGDSVVWQFDPSTATPIYVVASGSTTVRVVEI